MRVLITGGAGYIGSHTVLAVLAAGHEVVIADNFSNSKPTVLSRLEELSGTRIPVHTIDLCDATATEELFAQEPVEAVIHFAALKAVGESVAQPLEYYRNNISSVFSLLAAMRRHDVHRFVFSSSATVYGPEAPVPNHEDYTPLRATNPYGWSKVMIEQIVTDIAAAHPGLRAALLRYYNPVGSHPSGRIGEDPQGIPNNLMPFVAQVAVGRRERVQVFGGDYPTADGTGERDYIHVEDLAAGHIAALDHLDTLTTPVRAFNLGTGRPSSVLEVITAYGQAVGRELPYEIGARRAGDLSTSFADPSRARDELGWTAERTLADMCQDSWRWQQANPEGYPDA